MVNYRKSKKHERRSVNYKKNHTKKKQTKKIGGFSFFSPLTWWKRRRERKRVDNLRRRLSSPRKIKTTKPTINNTPTRRRNNNRNPRKRSIFNRLFRRGAKKNKRPVIVDQNVPSPISAPSLPIAPEPAITQPAEYYKPSPGESYGYYHPPPEAIGSNKVKAALKWWRNKNYENPQIKVNKNPRNWKKPRRFGAKGLPDYNELIRTEEKNPTNPTKSKVIVVGNHSVGNPNNPEGWRKTRGKRREVFHTLNEIEAIEKHIAKKKKGQEDANKKARRVANISNIDLQKIRGRNQFLRKFIKGTPILQYSGVKSSNNPNNKRLKYRTTDTLSLRNRDVYENEVLNLSRKEADRILNEDERRIELYSSNLAKSPKLQNEIIEYIAGPSSSLDEITKQKSLINIYEMLKKKHSVDILKKIQPYFNKNNLFQGNTSLSRSGWSSYIE